MTGRQRTLLPAAVFLASAVVFIVDTTTPHGVAEWVLYLPIVLGTVWSNNLHLVATASVLSSILILIGFFLSPDGGLTGPLAFVNRVMGLLALWLITAAAIVICTRSRRLNDVMAKLHEEIAERKQTGKALAASEERLRLAVEGAGMGTWDVNLETGKVVWSDTHFRMLGYQPVVGGEVTREMWWSCIHPEDRARVVDAEEQAHSQRTLFNSEYRVNRPDSGETVWLSVAGRFLYDEAGNATRFVGVSFDITRQKKLEREVLAIAAHERRDIGQQLHDGVGQELTGLGLMASALTQRLDNSRREQRLAEDIVRGLERVHHQVRDISHGLLPVQVEANGLRAALQDLATKAVERSGISIKFECPEELEVQDHTAATQLFYIAQEALSNALRHGQPEHIRLALSPDRDGLCLIVEDDGTGIQEAGWKTRGSGLRIMNYRVGLLGGTLQVRPAENGGTIVACHVPGGKKDDTEESRNGAAGKDSDRR